MVGVIEPEPETDTNNHVYPAPSTSQRSLPRTSSKKFITSLPKVVPSTTFEPEPVEKSEPEVAPIASKEAPAESRHQSQTAANLFSNDTVIENYLPPLSSPSPVRQKVDVVEISSDEESGQVIEPGKVEPVVQIKPVAQSRIENAHGSATAQVTSHPEPQPEVRIVFSQSKKPKRSLTVEVVQPNNPPPSVPTVSPIREIDAVSDKPEPETKNHVYPAPSTSQHSLPQTPPKKVAPALSKLFVEPNNPLPSVPTVSPIQEIGGVEPEPETNNHVFPASSALQRSLPQTPPSKVIPASKLLVQTSNPLSSVPAVSPIGEIDVVGDIAPETQPETNNHVDTSPSTPQRSLPQTPPKKVIISSPKAVPSTTVELIPALSKLPSIPLHTLTEAELDMTVEEWIRYQMDVEYDKFRRDGERELQRFRNQAEEVRKTIEGL
jgi:hypothetical protein